MNAVLGRKISLSILVIACVQLFLIDVGQGLTCWNCISDIQSGCQWAELDVNDAEQTSSDDCKFCLTQRVTGHDGVATVYRSCSKRCPRSRSVTQAGERYEEITRCCTTDLCNVAQHQ